MSLEAWSERPKIDELSLTDVLMRRVPSSATKNQEIPFSDIVNFVPEFGMHTGVREGLTLSVNADDTKFDFAAGTAIILNRNPDPLNTTVTRIVFSSPTVAIDDLFLGDTFTFVFMDNTGTIIQRTTPPTTLDDLHNLIFLGQLRHFGGVIVTVDDTPIVAQGSSSSHIAELVFAGGVTIQGALIESAGADLTLAVTAGILEQFGRGRTVNQNAPNEAETSAQDPIPAATFFKAYINGTGELIVDNSNNLLDPTMFNEDGLGTLETVPANRFTIIRVFEAAQSEAIIFYYGTESFATAIVAESAVEQTFTEHPDTRLISPVAEIIIKQNITDIVSGLAAGDVLIKTVTRRV